LTWVSGGGETSFNVYGSPNNSVFSVIGTTANGTLSLSLLTLTPSTAYSFKVTGVNGSGESPGSNVVAAVTAGITPVTTTPTLGKKFQDLILDVAEYLGVADYSNGTAAIPTDAHDLDMCKRLVNDGYRRFLIEKEWFFLNVDMTLTPDGLNYIFDLPADFQGELLSDWTYPVTGPISRMTRTGEDRIRAMRAGTNTSGYPTLYALQAKDSVDATTDTARWQVVFWPTPTDNTLLLTSRYRRYPMALSSLTDRSVAGPVHDTTVSQACKAAAEIQRYGQQGPQEQLYQTHLNNSKRKDDASVPTKIGDYADRSDDSGIYGQRRPRDQYRVDSYDGTSVLG
jgi:hypothetical protein